MHFSMGLTCSGIMEIGVNIAVLVAGYGVAQLLGKFTVILGGIGVVEATMVGLYESLSVPRGQLPGCRPCISPSVVLAAADAGRHRVRDLF
jgi:hypothetical protein